MTFKTGNKVLGSVVIFSSVLLLFLSWFNYEQRVIQPSIAPNPWSTRA